MRTNLAERLGYEPEEETRERQERLWPSSTINRAACSDKKCPHPVPAR